MNAKQALWAVLGMQFVAGMAGTAGSAPGQWPAILAYLLASVAGSYLMFHWYCRDSDDYGYRRSRWLSMAMVSVTMLTVPYYLLRSRVRGQRGRAMWRAAGFAVLMGVCTFMGAGLNELMS